MSLLFKKYYSYQTADSTNDRDSSTGTSTDSSTTTTPSTTTSLSNASLAVKDKSGNVGVINGLTSSDISKISTAISNVNTIKANYVTTNTTQTISGVKTFSTLIKSQTPDTTSNTTDVATTAWVTTKISSTNAPSATKLATARTIALSGGATGTATSFDGTANITIPVTAVDGSKVTGTVPAATKATQDGSGNTITSKYTTLDTSQTVSGYKTFSNGLKTTTLTAGNLELSTTTPYIDFHYNNSTADYTSRIIESSSGVLNCTAKLTVNKDIVTSTWCYAVVFKATSDRNLKKNIEEVSYDLSSLNTYRYQFKKDKNEDYHIGLIAQEVEKIMPEAVSKNDKGNLVLDYNAITAALVAEVNALKKRVTELENK